MPLVPCWIFFYPGEILLAPAGFSERQFSKKQIPSFCWKILQAYKYSLICKVFDATQLYLILKSNFRQLDPTKEYRNVIRNLHAIPDDYSNPFLRKLKTRKVKPQSILRTRNETSALKIKVQSILTAIVCFAH